MFCPHCGHQLPDGASFCPNCGSSLKKYQSTSIFSGISLPHRTPSFALVIISLLQLLGAVLTAFTPIFGGARYYDELTPLLGWKRSSQDVYMHGYGDVEGSGKIIMVLTIIFLFIIAATILMSIMKQWVKTSAFLSLGTYILFLVICQGVIKNDVGEAPIKAVGWINICIFSIAAFITIGFTRHLPSSQQRMNHTKMSVQLTQKLAKAGFSGARLGVIACFVTIVPGALFLGWVFSDILYLGNFGAILGILLFASCMIFCMIQIKKKSSRMCMIIAAAVGGISSFMSGMMVGSLILGILGLAGVTMMIIALIAVCTEGRLEVASVE
ncbi:MAG: zinc ribbon domain-containing protein [Clostridiales bacterium]|nr:zinc ribbon domain-containing protein [Clostridiales bacterium]